MPRSGLPAVGSFSEWERKVRDLIFWLTGHDLSGDFKKNKLDDPEQQEDAAVLSALHAYFGEDGLKPRKLMPPLSAQPNGVASACPWRFTRGRKRPPL